MKALLALGGLALAAWLLWPVTEALGAGGMGMIIGGLAVLCVVIIVWILAQSSTDAAYGHMERMSQIGQERERHTESHYAITRDGGGYKQIEDRRW